MKKQWLYLLNIFGATLVRSYETILRKDDFATLYLAMDSSAMLIDHLSVNEEFVQSRIDFSEDGINVMQSAMCGKISGNEKTMQFVFNEDTMIDPVRSADYMIKIRQNCSTIDYHQSSVVLGMRTATSPLWHIWTYASFARNEVRLGRKHPKNIRSREYYKILSAKRSDVVPCAGSKEETLCLMNDAILRERGTYNIDFHSNDEKIYVPHEVYVHYTSVSNCNHARTLDQWPSLDFILSGDAKLEIRARLLVPADFEKKEDLPSVNSERAMCAYLSRLIRKGGILVAHDDDTSVSVGNIVFHDYTMDRDYIANTMRMRRMVSQDHFIFTELLAVIFVYSTYIWFKSQSMERLSSYIIGIAPICTVCKKPMIRLCAMHASYTLIFLHYAAILSLYTIAWYSVIISSKVGVGYNEEEIVVWTFVVLGVATLELLLSVGRSIYLMSPAAAKNKLHVFAVQNWEFMYASAVETTCTVALFTLTSVVRTDDLSSLLSVTVAFIVVYDGFRRFVAEWNMFIVKMFYSRQLSPVINIIWIVRAFVVGLGINVIFTTYIMTTFVITVALTSKTFSSMFVLFAVYLAVSLNFVYVRRSMSAHLKVETARDKKK